MDRRAFLRGLGLAPVAAVAAAMPAVASATPAFASGGFVGELSRYPEGMPEYAFTISRKQAKALAMRWMASHPVDRIEAIYIDDHPVEIGDEGLVGLA